MNEASHVCVAQFLAYQKLGHIVDWCQSMDCELGTSGILEKVKTMSKETQGD